MRGDRRPPSTASRSWRRGQAMVELVVGLVALLVVFAGMIEIGTLNRLHTRAMIDARRKVADNMMLANYTDMGGSATHYIHYIHDWSVGADNRHYTEDDTSQAGSPATLQGRVVGYANPDALQAFRPGNRISMLDQGVDPKSQFGLMQGHGEYTTNLLPIVRQLIYNAQSIKVEADAVMTWTEGVP